MEKVLYKISHCLRFSSTSCRCTLFSSGSCSNGSTTWTTTAKRSKSGAHARIGTDNVQFQKVASKINYYHKLLKQWKAHQRHFSKTLVHILIFHFCIHFMYIFIIPLLKHIHALTAFFIGLMPLIIHSPSKGRDIMLWYFLKEDPPHVASLLALIFSKRGSTSRGLTFRLRQNIGAKTFVLIWVDLTLKTTPPPIFLDPIHC